jgi:hypothetical protein
MVYFGYKHQGKVEKIIFLFQRKVEKIIFLFQRKVEKGDQKKDKKIEYSKYKNPSCEAMLENTF